MRLLSRFALFAAGVMLASGIVSATPIVIDHFDELQTVEVSGPGLNPILAESNAPASSAIGGRRYISVTRTIGAGIANASSNSIPSIFQISNESNANGVVLVFWDGGSDTTFTPTGLGGIDLTDGGINDRIRVGLTSDLVVNLTLTVFTNGSDYSTRTFSSPGGGTALPFTINDLLFSSFTPTGAGADFANVGGIALTFVGPQSFDMQMDIIQADTGVPEPATMALLGVGMAALGFLRRKRAR